MKSAADGRHGPGGLQEIWVVDAVTWQLAGNAALPAADEIIIRCPGPHRRTQVTLRRSEQAVPHLTVRGQPDPVAGCAERPRHRADHAHRLRTAIDEERLGWRGTALCRVRRGQGEFLP